MQAAPCSSSPMTLRNAAGSGEAQRLLPSRFESGSTVSGEGDQGAGGALGRPLKPAPSEPKAETVVSTPMLTAINSDLPGQVTGQVRENVYDSGTGKHLLIPQGTRLVGLYGHHIA